MGGDGEDAGVGGGGVGGDHDFGLWFTCGCEEGEEAAREGIVVVSF